MKAMLLTELVDVRTHPTPLSLQQIPEPIPGEGEVLIKVSTCGVCHTELDEIEGRTAPSVVDGNRVDVDARDAVAPCVERFGVETGSAAKIEQPAPALRLPGNPVNGLADGPGDVSPDSPDTAARLNLARRRIRSCSTVSSRERESSSSTGMKPRRVRRVLSTASIESSRRWARLR